MAMNAMSFITRWRLNVIMLVVFVVAVFFMMKSLTNDQETLSLSSSSHSLYVHSLPGGYARAEFVPRKKSLRGCENNPSALFDYGKEEVLGYCNSPFKEEEEEIQEGISSKGYKLKAAYIIIRHGNRSPMGRNDSVVSLYKMLKMSCKFDDDFLQQAPEMEDYVRTMTRHVYLQQQFNGFAMFPNTEKCREAMLTPLGATQHVILGRRLHEKYVKKHKLISEVFTQNEVFLTSTNRGRTVQSALAFLFGFLPSFSFSKFRLKIGSYPHDNFCEETFLGQPCKCANVGRFKSQMVEDVRPKFKVDPMLLKVSKMFQHGTKKAPWPGEIMDVLMGYACQNDPLPKFYGNCVDINDFEDVVKATYNVVAYQGESDSHRKAAMLMAYPLVYKISKMMATHLQDSKTRPQAVKFALFSGHDTTISPVLTALGLHDNIWPPYASRLVFELYQSAANARMYIRTLYLGKDVTRKLRFCVGSLIDGMCPLKKFMTFAKTGLLREFQTSSYDVACNG